MQGGERRSGSGAGVATGAARGARAASATPERASARAGVRALRHPLVWTTAVAAVSLLAQRTPDFDPTAWLIWGRQIVDGWLSTSGGPSWKPLTVAITTVLSLAGDDLAPMLWLIIARAAGLLGLVMAYRLAVRLAGRRSAGVIAAGGLALAPGYLYNAARGDSEGMLVALTLMAVSLHLDGRRHAALLAGTAAALLRPEIWPVLALYGVLLLRRSGSKRTLALLMACAVAVVALWLVPERIGGGDWFRAAARAQIPADQLPGDTGYRFFRTLLYAAGGVVWPFFVGAALAFVAARRRAPRTAADQAVLAMGAGAVAWTVIVALMAEFGFSGNLRYLTVPVAAVCVLGAIGARDGLRVLRAVPGRLAPAAVGAFAVIALGVALVLLALDVDSLAEDGRRYGRELPQLIERAGGRTALVACGPVGADHFSRQALAWQLHLRQLDVRLGIGARVRTVLGLAGTGAATDGRPPIRLRHGEWVLRSYCSLPRRP